MIIYTNKIEPILVDDEDYDWLSKYTWCLTYNKSKVPYAHFSRNALGNFRMHRMIYLKYHPNENPEMVDHIDGDTLDNRKQNLRAATGSQNRWNSGPTKLNTSGIKGVTKTIYNTYRVSIRENGKRHWFGTFKTLEEAIKVKEAAEIKYHGKFAFGATP